MIINQLRNVVRESSADMDAADRRLWSEWFWKSLKVDMGELLSRLLLWLAVDPIAGLVALGGLHPYHRKTIERVADAVSRGDRDAIRSMYHSFTNWTQWHELACLTLLRAVVKGNCDGLITAYIAAWETSDASAAVSDWQKLTPMQVREQNDLWATEGAENSRKRRAQIVREKLMELCQAPSNQQT